jgi:hypothetical protein
MLGNFQFFSLYRWQEGDYVSSLTIIDHPTFHSLVGNDFPETDPAGLSLQEGRLVLLNLLYELVKLMLMGAEPIALNGTPTRVPSLGVTLCLSFGHDMLLLASLNYPGNR